MTTQNLRPRFEVHKLDGTGTRRIAKPKVQLDKDGEVVTNDKGHPVLLGGFDYEDREVDAGWMVYFPSGASIHVWTEEEMIRQGFLEDPTLVDIIPPRAPISILRLQTVIRPSMDMFLKTSPAYSTKYPVAPEVDNLEIMKSATSLGVTASLNSPLTLIRKLLGLGCIIHCVDSTISTSLVPIPKAMAPKAPCVEVCESPQTMVAPGTVIPCSGPITCTIPFFLCPSPQYGMSCALAFSSNALN